MAIQPRFRIAAALGALIAPMALVATTVSPADAGASRHKHEVTMYKVEKNVKLAGVDSDTVGDLLTQSLSCNSGDIVLDGMWQVKHVDQYQPVPNDPDDDDDLFPDAGTTTSDPSDVYVKASYPSGARSWTFEFKNNAQGDAQLKLYLTCIKNKTEANKHTHRILTDKDMATSQTTVAAPGANRYRWDMVTNDWACDADEFFVAPGFKLGAGVQNRLIASIPRTDGRAWLWEFGSTAPTAITFYGKCIDRKVTPYGSHTHVIAMKHLPNVTPGDGVSIPDGDPTEAQFTCDQGESSYHGYKAMVGWFWMVDWEDNWFLGMEPRPKTRVFSFWNEGTGDADVNIGSLCINSRTSNQFAS